MNPRKRISCFFIIDNHSMVVSIEVDIRNPNCECMGIQSIIEQHGINPYNLSFVMDGTKQTYTAEYLHSRADFQSRESLL